MRRIARFLMMAAGVLSALVLIGPGCSGTRPPAGGELVVFCGAGIRPPMEVIRKSFEQARGCTVKVNYAGSGVLLGKLKSGVKADVYIPGDTWWIRKARDMGLVNDHETAAWFVPVIAVRKGNPKGIKSLKDLARENVTVGLGNRDACAVGNVARDVLAAAGLAGSVKPDYESHTVNELANQVKLAALDAAIIWDATARQYPQDIEAVSLEDGNFHAVPFAVSIVSDTKQRALAQAFADFASGESGAKAFRDEGYQVPGPSLRVGCGGSMRPPVAELADLFKKETGRNVLTNYGGSGTVLLQIEESGEGDIYICHDPYAYTCEDKKISERWHTMAYLHTTLAVQKGNPKEVKGLKDLLREDLKVGLSHRKYSSRGQILWAMFEKHGMADAMRKRKVFEERTHTLVNQLKLGAVDVATLWDAPARAMEEIDVVPIEKQYEVDAVTSATSGRTYSVKHVKVTVVRLTMSKEPLLAAQFARLCVSDRGREILEKHRFDLPPKP